MLMTIFVVILTTVSLQAVYAQSSGTEGEQTTLSENLANDPVAQDILRKIELTKKWIAELEQREYEKIQTQNELNDKRQVALDRLNQDLKEWEKLWEEYSSRNAFEKFVADKPSGIKDVFWDQFEFKEMKVKAGRDALKNVLANGGSLKQARQAYLDAAETKRIELIEANAQFNIRHNLAYYQQQLLFDLEGQFFNSTETRERLAKHYTDFRADPAYLAANPNDKLSYDALGTTRPDTVCRDGYVVIHRFHADDYVCTTEETAQMWIVRGMGELPKTHISSSPSDSETLTESDVSSLITNRDLQTTVYLINEEFRVLDDKIESEKLAVIKDYNILYDKEKQESKKAEKELIQKFSADAMTKEEFSELLLAIRDKYKDSMQDILDKKIEVVDDLKKKHDKLALVISHEYKDDAQIEIFWNSDKSRYEAKLTNSDQ